MQYFFFMGAQADVGLELPEKHELIVRFELTAQQKESYRVYIRMSLTITTSVATMNCFFFFHPCHKAILTRNFEVLNRGCKSRSVTSLQNVVRSYSSSLYIFF